MEKEAVKVTLFGRFSLKSGTIILKEEDIHANKMVQLLAYIIVHRDMPVNSKKLNEEFWSGNSRNPESALRNLMYRLRGKLREQGLEECICTQPGGYQWNPGIPVETDYEQFEKINQDIGKQTDDSVREELCREVIACYQGNVSARLACEPWLQPRILKYQMMYLEAAKILAGIYEQENEWAKLEMLCQEVAIQEPLDENIQYWLIRSLQQQKKYDQALFQYEKAKKLFHEKLGIKIPKKLEGILQNVSAGREIQADSIHDIMREACEKEEPSGAFFCDYQIFRQIYRLEMRRVGRIGISEYLLLLTVQKIEKSSLGGVITSSLLEGAGILEQILKETLRIGDVVTKNGHVQYVVLLYACSYEAGVAAAERIRRKFLRKLRYQRLELRYELEELSLQWQGAMER